MQSPKIVFKVINPREPLPTRRTSEFVLQQDNWNDYSFQTQYQLYVTRETKNGVVENDLIASVKILKAGQTGKDGLQVTKNFDQLGKEYCSVGESLDYYERLNALSSDQKVKVLVGLNDVVYDQKLEKKFSSENGWSTSLFRDQRDGGADFRQLALSLVTGDYTSLAEEGLAFGFNVNGWKDKLTFTFAPPDSDGTYIGWGESILPGRIAVVIGRNGSGKSTLLSRLARVAYGSATERVESDLKLLGVLEPVGLGFPRIVSISFCPFDSFKLPGTAKRDREKLREELEAGEGRFIYVGVRDLASEKSFAVDNIPSKVGDEVESGDRLSRTRVKSIDRLARDFVMYVERIREKSRGALMERMCKELVPDSPLANLDEVLKHEHYKSRLRSAFITCSSGHKIVLLTTLGLIANIERRSLVLFDEPETHLHPPLLASLMHALRRILREYQAFAIVGTHSAVVVQETMGQHVSVVRREGEVITVSPVKIETFGENIGLITSEVFGLHSEMTDYHRVLDRLLETTGKSEAIEQLFLNDSMSHQARAYILSRTASRKKGD